MPNSSRLSFTPTSKGPEAHKLSLNKQTLTTLGGQDLRVVQGGTAVTVTTAAPIVIGTGMIATVIGTIVLAYEIYQLKEISEVLSCVNCKNNNPNPRPPPPLPPAAPPATAAVDCYSNFCPPPPPHINNQGYWYCYNLAKRVGHRCAIDELAGLKTVCCDSCSQTHSH